jgi:hypothetical protein
MLAKVKPLVEIDRWRVEGRTVIHKSWAGYTWRKKGSDLAYTAGCHFGPPPPPVEHVIWRIRIYSDTASGMSSMTVERMTESEYNIHSVEVAQAVGGVGAITVITEILELTLEGAHIKKRVIEEFDGIVISDFILEAVVPPFNGLDIRWGALLHEQVHEL